MPSDTAPHDALVPAQPAWDVWPSRAAAAAYLLAVAALVGRVAWLDDWNAARYIVLAVFVVTVRPDYVANASTRALVLGVAFFTALCMSATYLPNIWFSIAYQLHHAKHYLWRGNDFMQVIPFNDARFLWSRQLQPFTSWMQWIYINGFDMVVWIPIVRSLCAFDPWKMARYALSAHIIQFPLIMPFFAAIRVDEVWSVLGHPDMLERGWSDETRLDIGANCFPSMHTSVAFAILLLALREKSRVYRVLMVTYASSIIFSTMYMEVHWVVDVLAGLVLGWVAVKLTDSLLGKLAKDRSTTVPAV